MRLPLFGPKFHKESIKHEDCKSDVLTRRQNLDVFFEMCTVLHRTLFTSSQHFALSTVVCKYRQHETLVRYGCENKLLIKRTLYPFPLMGRVSVNSRANIYYFGARKKQNIFPECGAKLQCYQTRVFTFHTLIKLCKHTFGIGQ